MTGSDSEGRQRVRALVIGPAEEDGFRFKRGTPDDKARAYLDRLVDQLAYLSEPALKVVAGWLIHHGDGAGKCFWPPLRSLIGLAEALQPRPIEDVPGLASWFASKAGPEALAAGRLVAEFDFWGRKKRPPLNAHDWRQVEDKAADYRRRLLLLAERRRDGRFVDDQEAAFERWHLALEKRAMALVEAGVVKREGQDDAA